MNIEKVFPTVQSFDSLHNIAGKATVHLSFWGVRYITIQGYEGRLPVDELTERVFALVEKNVEFSEYERDIGRRIARRIDCVYEMSSQQYKTSHFVTKIFYQLRNLSKLFSMDGRYGVRYRWEICIEKFTFEYYTRKQLKEVYGLSPGELKYKRLLGEGLLRDLKGTERWLIKKSILPKKKWFVFC